MRVIKIGRCSQRRGSALLLILLSMVLLLVTGTGMLSLGLHSRTLTARTASNIAARCAADAGLTSALFELNNMLQEGPWDDSDLPQATDQTLPGCDATYTYAVTGNIADGYVVESIGKFGRAEKCITAALRLQGLFEYAVFGDRDVALKNSAAIDWYNHDADDQNLQVGTNNTEFGAVDLKNGSIVNGDVVVGVGGDPDVVINGTWATITGETYAMTDQQPLPQITVPAWLQALPSAGTIEDDTTVTTPAKYDEIDLNNGKTITIDGPVALYIVGDVVIKNSAELQMVDDDGVSLTLYVGGNVEVKNSGAINNLSQDPKTLEMYGINSCQSIILKNDSDFYGTIYAPNADVEMMNSADTFGAVIAKSFDQKNSAAFNYDASLRDAGMDDEGVRFVIKQWRED